MWSLESLLPSAVLFEYIQPNVRRWAPLPVTFNGIMQIGLLNDILLPRRPSSLSATPVPFRIIMASIRFHSNPLTMASIAPATMGSTMGIRRTKVFSWDKPISNIVPTATPNDCMPLPTPTNTQQMWIDRKARPTCPNTNIHTIHTPPYVYLYTRRLR